MTRLHPIFALAIVAGLTCSACHSGDESRNSATAIPTTDGSTTADDAADELVATIGKLLERLRRDPEDEGAVGALAALADAATPALRAALKNPDPEFRLAVVQALRAIPGGESRTALVGALEDANEEVRLSAVEELGERADRSAVEPLLARYAKDDDSQVRYEILTTLGLIGDPSTASFLATESGSQDPYVRMWAADALCVMEAPQAVDVATKLLGDPDGRVRRRVLASCDSSLTRDDAVAGLIHIAVHAEAFEEAVQARRILQSLRAGPGSGDLSAKLTAEATASLEGDDALQAALVLADLNDARGLAVLRSNYANPDPFVRHHVAFELGRLGGPESVPPLIDLLEDPVELVAATAHDALLNFADRGNEEAKQAAAAFKGKTFPKRLKDLATQGSGAGGQGSGS